MSAEEQSLSRAEKKAQRDAERQAARQQKGKKRKIAAVADEEGADGGNVVGDTQDDAAEPAAQLATPPKSASKSESRKRRPQSSSLDAEGSEVKASEATKRRKKNDGTSASTEPAADGEQTDAVAKPSKSRFILFIGNLPFKTTDAALQTHFAKLQPFTLRHRTDPKTKKSKGFAFLEFENYDRMKTCLKLYHHSSFDPDSKELGGDGKSNGKHARKINVELTAGGGGKGGDRKEKIKAKNVRLEEQRKRRAEAEKKAGLRKEKKEGGKTVQGKGDAAVSEVEAPAPDENLSGMHPSRLAQLNR